MKTLILDATARGVTISRSLVTGGLCLMAAACGSPETPPVLTPEQQELAQQVEARQSHFQDLGAAFKAINDEIKAGRPASTTTTFSIDSVVRYAPQVRTWFPEGTGPELGVETEAKAAIWEQPEEFEAALADFERAVEDLATAKQSGEPEAIKAAFMKTGGTCKSCHDKFREED